MTELAPRLWRYPLTNVIMDRSVERSAVQWGSAAELVGVDASVRGGLRPFPGFKEVYELDFYGDANHDASSEVKDFFPVNFRVGADQFVYGFVYRSTRAYPNQAQADVFLDYYDRIQQAWVGGTCIVEDVSPTDQMHVEVFGRLGYVFIEGRSPTLFYISDSQRDAAPVLPAQSGSGSLGSSASGTRYTVEILGKTGLPFPGPGKQPTLRSPEDASQLGTLVSVGDPRVPGAGQIVLSLDSPGDTGLYPDAEIPTVGGPGTDPTGEPEVPWPGYGGGNRPFIRSVTHSPGAGHNVALVYDVDVQAGDVVVVTVTGRRENSSAGSPTESSLTPALTHNVEVDGPGDADATALTMIDDSAVGYDDTSANPSTGLFSSAWFLPQNTTVPGLHTFTVSRGTSSTDQLYLQVAVWVIQDSTDAGQAAFIAKTSWQGSGDMRRGGGHYIDGSSGDPAEQASSQWLALQHTCCSRLGYTGFVTSGREITTSLVGGGGIVEGTNPLRAFQKWSDGPNTGDLRSFGQVGVVPDNYVTTFGGSAYWNQVIGNDGEWPTSVGQLQAHAITTVFVKSNSLDAAGATSATAYGSTSNFYAWHDATQHVTADGLAVDLTDFGDQGFNLYNQGPNKNVGGPTQSETVNVVWRANGRADGTPAYEFAPTGVAGQGCNVLYNPTGTSQASDFDFAWPLLISAGGESNIVEMFVVLKARTGLPVSPHGWHSMDNQPGNTQHAAYPTEGSSNVVWETLGGTSAANITLDNPGQHTHPSDPGGAGTIPNATAEDWIIYRVRSVLSGGNVTVTVRVNGWPADDGTATVIGSGAFGWRTGPNGSMGFGRSFETDEGLNTPYFDGYIGEIILADGLGDTEALEQHLSTKWNIPLYSPATSSAGAPTSEPAPDSGSLPTASSAGSTASCVAEMETEMAGFEIRLTHPDNYMTNVARDVTLTWIGQFTDGSPNPTDLVYDVYFREMGLGVPVLVAQGITQTSFYPGSIYPSGELPFNKTFQWYVVVRRTGCPDYTGKTSATFRFTTLSEFAARKIEPGDYAFGYYLRDSRTGRTSAFSFVAQVRREEFRYGTDENDNPILQNSYIALELVYDSEKYDQCHVYRSVKVQDAGGTFVAGILQLDGLIELAKYQTRLNGSGEVFPDTQDLRHAIYFYQLEDKQLVQREAFAEQILFDEEMPYAGAAGMLDHVMLCSKILGASTDFPPSKTETYDPFRSLGEIRWSSIRTLSPELFPPLNRYTPPIITNEVIRFMRTGANMIGFSRDRMYLVRREGILLRPHEIHEGYGIATHRGVDAASSRLYYVTTKGLKSVDPMAQLEDVSVFDDLLIREWKLSVADMSVAHDPSNSVTFLLNPTEGKTACLWHNTAMTSLLHDTPFKEVRRGAWPDDPADYDDTLVERALFLLNPQKDDPDDLLTDGTNPLKPRVYVADWCRTKAQVNTNWPEYSLADPALRMLDTDWDARLFLLSASGTQLRFDLSEGYGKPTKDVNGCEAYVLWDANPDNIGLKATIKEFVAEGMGSFELRLMADDSGVFDGLTAGARIAVSPVYTRWVGSPMAPFVGDADVGQGAGSQDFHLIRHVEGLGLNVQGVSGPPAQTYNAVDQGEKDSKFSALVYEGNASSAKGRATPRDLAGADVKSVDTHESLYWAAFGYTSGQQMGRTGIHGAILAPAVEIFCPDMDFRIVSAIVSGRILNTLRSGRPS